MDLIRKLKMYSVSSLVGQVQVLRKLIKTLTDLALVDFRYLFLICHTGCDEVEIGQEDFPAECIEVY